MCQLRGVENASSCLGASLQRWSGRNWMYSTTQGWIAPSLIAQCNHWRWSARRWMCTKRLISADGMGLTMAASLARLPAPITTVPLGKRYSPTRWSKIKE